MAPEPRFTRRGDDGAASSDQPALKNWRVAVFPRVFCRFTHIEMVNAEGPKSCVPGATAPSELPDSSKARDVVVAVPLNVAEYSARGDAS